MHSSSVVRFVTRFLISRAFFLTVRPLTQICGKLTSVVEETGALKNATRDFEDKIDQLTAEKVVQNLEKIANDVELVRKENVELVATIKKAQLGVA